MPKDVQITVQLNSFHILARLCSKSLKLGFSSRWIKNFQMCKLDLAKAGEPEIKFPTSVGSEKKQGNSKKTSNSALLTTLNPLTGGVTTNCGKFLKRWEYQITYLPPVKLCRSRSNSWNQTWNHRSNYEQLLDHGESKGVPQNIYFCFIDYTKAFDYVDHNKQENF